MPSYSSPSPPITDPRPLPTVHPSLSSPPAANKANLNPVPIKPTPAAKVDSGPPPRGREAPLSFPPSAHKTNPTPVPTKPTPIPKVDSGPSPGAKEPVADTPDQNENIKMDVFGQILDLDDDDDFAQEMIDGYLSQAEDTFNNMDTALEKKDLPSLSSLGHFLKGSSAALGLFRVQSSCEDIQHYGQLKEGDKVIEKDVAIAKISTTLARARKEYGTAKSALQHELKLFNERRKVKG